MNSYDLVVIGSGPAGEKAAAMAAYFNKSVAIVERDSKVGGTVVSRGGVPSKTLREAAMYLSGFQSRDVYGVSMDLSPDVMLDLLRSRASEVMQLMSEVVAANIARHGIDLHTGEATLRPEGGVTITSNTGDNMTLDVDVVLIATGSRPFRPDTIPFDDPAVDDSDSILALDTIPRTLVVIGGGPVGTEYASISTALGVEVTVVDAAPRLIPFADEEISHALADCLRARGAEFMFNSPDSTVHRTENGITITFPDGQELHPDKVLFAAGRKGNTEGLGLDDAGVELNERGHIVVDEHYRTTAPHVYAVGDVVGPPALASVSAEQGRIAVSHAFDLGVVDALDPLPVYGVYSLPEVGMVGPTEQALRDQGIDYAVGRASFEQNARSRIAGRTEGMVKLIVDKASHQLLATHILGIDAAELVHIGQAAIHAGDSVERFIHSTFNVPTRSEAYKYAAYDALQDISGHRLSSPLQQSRS